ncbi:MlaD family protein [Williamsia sp.]|uniref:MlaD family protein n=1 Tax=Williamsia sp. TaxID=1872085 RepID=UPI002F95C7AE
MRSAGAATKRLLLVLAVVILAVYTIVQAINRPVDGSVETYQAEFSDAFGLHNNADVRVRGVQVGKVLDVELLSSGVALVKFTVRKQDRLTDTDELAIRFQNLVGQRYLAVTKVPSDAPAVVSGTTIPATKTTGSFDITTLFNGLRPILQGADPAVFNTFASNMLALIQGEGGVGVGDVLGDVERLTQFATDKSAMIRIIVNNLGVISAELQGKSAMIKTLMESLGTLFDTLEVNLELLKGAFGEGAKVFPPIVELMTKTFDLGLGGHDNVSGRLMELIPDTQQLTTALESIPTMLANINAMGGAFSFDAGCSRGEAPLPAMGDVLLGGGRLTLCKA